MSELEKYMKKLQIAEQKIRILEDLVENSTRELYTINTELDRQNKKLEQFTYITSHDLQEPLRTITSFVDLLTNQYGGKLDDTADEYLNFISSASTRMSALIKDLLDHSRIGFDKELTVIDCNTLLNDIRDDLASMINETNTTFEITELPHIEGFRTDLRMLFQNLISNAIKFRKEDLAPHIRISVEEYNAHWKFSLEDNGIGIEHKFKDKIFEIFQRLHSKIRLCRHWHWISSLQAYCNII